MKLERHTVSFCTTCYREIPALVSIERDGIFLRKECHEHGVQSALLEKDPVFYTHIAGLRSPTIYNGYFVDVTRRCNLRCEYCYYALEDQDPEGEYSQRAILDECAINGHLAPFILTGGEPTLRDDLPSLIAKLSDLGPVELITNGTRMAEPEFFDEITPLLTRNGNCLFHLSVHPQTDKWMRVVDQCREKKVRMGSMLMVVDDEAGFHAAIDAALAMKDVAMGFRIKAASRIWAEQKPPASFGSQRKIFVSDMLRWLEEAGHAVRVVETAHNKSVFVNVICDGVWLMLVSWHDTGNVDLREIDCAPYYRARNGEVANMVTAMLINEGMEKGFLKGRPVTGIGKMADVKGLPDGKSEQIPAEAT